MKHTHQYWLRQTIALSKHCVAKPTAFCVGAIIVNEKEEIVASGYSRDTNPHVHAEESAIQKAVADGIDLVDCTMYSSLEPCGERLSDRKSCVGWITEVKMKRVVFAAYEPATFVIGRGEEMLRDAGIEVIYAPVKYTLR